MTALLLSAVGAAAGGALFGPVGAFAGRIAGALAGSVIDNSVFGTSRALQGPRLTDLDIMTSTEGAPIPRAYGRVRLAGQVIWATRLQEVVATSTDSGGGKGGVGAPSTTSTSYSYFANFAVGVCEGPIGHVTRVWADGKPLDLDRVTYRIYTGSESQTADPLIVAKEGGDNAPAYRGLAYVVFERLPLAKFGNRLPQLSFEIVRPVGHLEQTIRAVTLIPGATEFGYEPDTVVRVSGRGRSAPENRHVDYAPSDVVASLDELQAVCPNLERVAVIVAWFGTDLRANHCEFYPGIDNRAKETHGATWSVAGVGREAAYLVSQVEGRAAYGGTPSDASVVDLIGELRDRGLKVTLYPFAMMDIPSGNALPDPRSGEAPQPAYPWRGEITCDPAPGCAGTPDGTSGAADQVAAFFGGDGDWGYRRMILHYASLAASAGGVDAFLIGSELKSLTRVRSAPGAYPAVDALVALAADVKEIVGDDTIVTYGADWTEYGAHVADADASEVRFPLDPLWASPAIDVVGIDYYAPLADWRDTPDHLDRAVASSIYDRDYLISNIAAGEDYDWYYVDDDARAAQERVSITDGLGKPWIFRAKDLWNFWANPHYEREGGAELGSPTAWVAHGKPIWLTEAGCPAVDKGANQPNVFPDPKSSTGGYPYFSSRRRDDLIQRRYLETLISAFAEGSELNPHSSVYDGPMVDPSGLHLWTWDARPFPVFPAAYDIWSDGPNWETGHWLNGRLGASQLEGLVSAVLSDSGAASFDASALGDGPVGYLIDRPMAPRAAIEPLSSIYAFSAAEEGGTLNFRPRGGQPLIELTEDDLVLPADGAPARLTRTQETELPREVSVGYLDAGADYRRAAAVSRRLVGGSSRVAQIEGAIVTNDAAAERRATILLQDLWAGRETATFAVPPSRMMLTPGDVVGLNIAGRRRLFEIAQVVDTEFRSVRARTIDPEIFDLPLAPPRLQPPAVPAAIGPVQALLLDLPNLDSQGAPILTRAAIFSDPWPGSVAVWRSRDGLSYERAALALVPAVMGVTLDDLPRGPTGRWDRFNRFRVQLSGGAISSATDEAVLGGANAAALRRDDGAWEIVQFANAELVAEDTYELSRLLRGQSGSEWAMADPLGEGAPFVLLDAHVLPIAQGLDMLDRAFQLRIVAAGRDHGDPAAVALDLVPSSTALRPLSPVHPRARRTDEGVALSWVRRARIDGDSWALQDVPLGEDQEVYIVDILSGDDIVRSLTADRTSAIYPEADELGDFGSAQTNLSVRIAQISASAGRGFPLEATLRV